MTKEKKIAISNDVGRMIICARHALGYAWEVSPVQVIAGFELWKKNPTDYSPSMQNAFQEIQDLKNLAEKIRNTIIDL